VNSISALIITFNEEENIGKCISSLNWCDEIIVFDSYSTDDTIKIAESLGAKIFQNKFLDFGTQRELARSTIQWKSDWVISVDADEQVDEELSKEIKCIVNKKDNNHVAYKVRRKDYFLGKWIKRASLYPSWHIRLFKHEYAKYEVRSVHEYPIIDGSIGLLAGHLIHNNFSKGIMHWWQRHLSYANLEANEYIKNKLYSDFRYSSLLTNDPVQRRRSLKVLSYRLPFRPLLRYLYMMIIRGAIIDGPVSWSYCQMISQYQRITDQLIREKLENRPKT
jgi:glycosyltransferase involved in cell wall biosynthesis